MEFYYCKKCNNVIIKLNNKNEVTCCGEEMTVLTPNTVDASFEKHVPEITVDKNIVKINVGSADHPMTEEHHIEFIVLKTESNTQIKYLRPDELPRTEFYLEDSDFEVYAYCNLHGLWKA